MKYDLHLSTGRHITVEAETELEAWGTIVYCGCYPCTVIDVTEIKA